MRDKIICGILKETILGERNTYIMTTGTHILLEGAPNTRDLGGIKTRDGKRIRNGRLIRSGNLSGITEGDARVLTEEYHLRHVADLRTPQERAEMPDRVLAGVTYHLMPVFGESVLGITREEGSERSMRDTIQEGMAEHPGGARAYMASVYAAMVTDPHSKVQFRDFLRLAARTEEGALLWHCSAGKDRVGVATALLLSALDVPEETIMEDYMMTNVYTAHRQKQTLERIFGSAQADTPEAERFRAMLEVDPAYLQGTMDAVKQCSKTAIAYITEQLQVTKEELERLRENYLE